MTNIRIVSTISNYAFSFVKMILLFICTLTIKQIQVKRLILMNNFNEGHMPKKQTLNLDNLEIKTFIIQTEKENKHLLGLQQGRAGKKQILGGVRVKNNIMYQS